MNLRAEAEVIEIKRAAARVAPSDLDHDEWNGAQAVLLTRYWSGEEAPAGRRAEARLLWSSAALCVRFVCAQTEPLVINSRPQTEVKTIGLWDRDVCEIFIAPNRGEAGRYFEFEAAPTCEWLDLAIHKIGDERLTDWEFRSGMRVAARADGGSVTIAMNIPWEAFGRKPLEGARWRANLTRCVGAGPERGYLAWRPTHTERPDFHVPEAFGEIEFKG